jgi:hypothetical protein
MSGVKEDRFMTIHPLGSINALRVRGVIAAALSCSLAIAPAMPAAAGQGLRTDGKTVAPKKITYDLQTGMTLNGGYVAAGTDLRNKGYGTITITGIPAGSTVAKALLYWDILAPTATARFAQGMLNGLPIKGKLFSQGADPCWDAGSNFAFRADVTSLVGGNGSYALTDIASGDTSGAYPFSVSAIPPLAEGATLVVIYENASMPLMDIALHDGNAYITGAYSVKVSNFRASDPVTFASVTTFGADGQANIPGEAVYFNGSLIATTDWDGADGPNELWDTHTHDAISLVAPGATSATISYPGNTNDCIIGIGAIVAVSSGAPQSVNRSARR